MTRLSSALTRKMQQTREAIEKCEKIAHLRVRASFRSQAKSHMSNVTANVIERNRQQSMHKYQYQLSQEESALLYYLVNLILLE